MVANALKKPSNHSLFLIEELCRYLAEKYNEIYTTQYATQTFFTKRIQITGLPASLFIL